MPSDSLLSLKHSLALIERGSRGTRAVDFAATGHGSFDDALGGGLMRARVHELVVEDVEEAGSGTGFAGVLAKRLAGELLWLREEVAERRMGRLYAEGMAAIGLDPARLVLGVLPDAAAVLRAAADAVRCPALVTVVVELWGDPRALDLTASRRLSLAAETSGVTALLLRVGAHPAPSVAQTRMRVVAAPSVPLAANAPGLPAWDIELLRQRGRPAGGRWRVEWDRERGELQDQRYETEALSGALVSLSADRPAGAIGAAGLRRAG